MHDNYVTYITNNASFRFGCVDCIRYVVWKRQLENNRKIKEDAKQYQKTLEYIKRDLEEFNRKNEQMIKKEAEKIYKGYYHIANCSEEDVLYCVNTGRACVECSESYYCKNKRLSI